MSSPTVSLQNSGTAAQTAATTVVVSLPQAPPEMAALPAGLVLPAVLMPAESPSETATMILTLPDGKEINVPVKPAHALWGPTPVSIKILPFDLKKAVSVRIHFSAPLPDVKKAVEDLSNAIRNESAVSSLPTKGTISVRAFVMHSVPEQITALMNEMESDVEQNIPPLKPNRSVQLELFTQTPVSSSPSLEENPVFIKQPEIKQTTSLETQTVAPLTFPETPETHQTSSVYPTPVLERTETTENKVQSSLPSLPAKETAVLQTEGQAVKTLNAIPEKTVLQQPSTVSVPSNVSEPKIHPDAIGTTRPFSSSVQTQPADTVQAFQNISADMKETSPHPLQQETRPAQTFSPSVQQEETDTRNLPVRIPLKGVVFDFKEQSACLVVTKIGVLALEEKIQLPHLTPVKVQITEIAPAPDFSAQTKTESDVFQNLSSTLNLLKETAPQTFESIKNIFPQTGNKLPLQLFSFINMITKNIPLTTFIGEANIAAIQSLGEKGQNIVKGIEKELSSISKKVSDGRSSWNGWTIPFLSGALVEPVSLYLQKPNENEQRQLKTNGKTNTVRFLLDLNLTQLGKIQMDGLSHRSERRFDLIVRHQDSLPAEFDDKIHFIFTQTLSALNYTGTVKTDHTDNFIVFNEHFETEKKQGVWA